MESTFKKDYKITKLSDGAELSFVVNRYGKTKPGLIGAIALILGFFVIPLFLMLSGFIKLGLIFQFLIVAVMFWFRKKTASITVKSDGLVFDRPPETVAASFKGTETAQLPFKDIQNFGVSTFLGNNKFAYLYAYAFGQDIQITSLMPHARASGICQEIAKLSEGQLTAA